MSDEPRRIALLAINFVIVILLLPLGIQLFEHVGLVLLGPTVIGMHGWLATVFAYLPILALLFVYLKATLEPLRTYGLRWKSTWIGRSALIGIVSAGVLLAVDVPTGILADFGVPTAPSLPVAVGFLLAWGLLAPFTEELLFRGVIQTAFARAVRSAWKVHPAVLIATAFEVLLHLSVPLFLAPDGQYAAALAGTLPQLAYVAAFGTIGGYVYQRAGSLAGPVLIHGLANAGELLAYWIVF